MKRSITLRISLAASLLVLVMVVGALPSRSDSGKSLLNRQSDDGSIRRHRRSGLTPLSYRSPGAAHKLMLPADDPVLEQSLLSSSAVRRAKRYRSYSLVEVSDADLSKLDASTLERAQLRDDLNLVMLKRGQIDTTGPEPIIDPDLRQSESNSPALHLVQLFGPPTPESFQALTATGAKVVGYVPNNAYLMWTTRSQRQRLHALSRSSEGVVQWDGPYHPAYKIDRLIKLDSIGQIRVSVQIADTPDADNTIAFVKAQADQVLMPEFRAGGVVRIKILVPSYRLKELALTPDVLGIEPWATMKLMDERADQIAAGALTIDTVNNIQISRPTGPGYLTYLNSLGFNSDFDFSVDFGDTGFDSGSADGAKMHPDFLNAAGASRIAYLHDFTGDVHPNDPTILPTHDQLGHGTINASIMGGLNTRSGSAFVDALGFSYGLGIAPFARIGVSKIFTDDGDFANFSYGNFTAQAYQGGARISSNSWGSNCITDTDCSFYGDSVRDDSQQFDALVRDADPGAPGNQSMTVLFAAGNDGDINAPSVAVPGTAKNVITVGISENVRDGNDRCVPAIGADSAQDVVLFGGWGPREDGGSKPDLVAPGTHMQGAASQDKLYDGSGVCNRYFPVGQTLYTWSSGTSHSTPLVAGGAALAFQFLKTTLGTEPSPALVKALVLNSTSYVTGNLGGDSLPGAHQGWGLLNVGRMLESTSRILYDESPSRTFTQSGGAPFETTGVIENPAKEFRAMLVWTDAPGNPATNAPYVNQLNLEVIVGGVVYRGNHFTGQYSTPGGQNDFVNNVQGVRLPVGTTGPIIIRVRPTTIAGDGVPGNGNPLDQDFALVVTNGRETPIPILAIDSGGDVSSGVTVQHSSGSSDASLIPGESARLIVSVRNQSQTTAANIQAATLSLASSSSSSAFEAIAPGQAQANSAPFQIQVPSNLRCGSVAVLQLQIDVSAGRFTLPVRVQVGRPNGAASRIFFEDVDNSNVKWKMKGGFGPVPGPATSGTMSFHAEDPGSTTDDRRLSQLFTKKTIKLPENLGQIRLSFFHIFNFEPGYDGGVLEISSDGGETWIDAGPLMLAGGYDGKVTSVSDNPLGRRLAWSARGQAGVFSQVVVDLSSFAGQNIKLRFLAGFDAGTGVREGYTGWFIDDIQITAVSYSCGQLQAENEVEATRPKAVPVKRTAARIFPH